MARLAAVALGIAIACGACHHDGGVSPSNVAKPAHQIDDLTLLPVDAEVVIGIDVAQAKASPLYQRLVAPEVARKAGRPVAMAQALCGFDPFPSVTSVVIGLKNLNDEQTLAGVIVAHGIDRARAAACFDKDIGDAEKDGTKITIDGDVVLATDRNGHHAALTFVDDRTALIVFGPDITGTDRVKAVASGANGLATSQTFVEMHRKLRAGDSAWVVINGNSPAMQSAIPLRFKAMFGSAKVGDGIAAEGTLRLPTVADATSLYDLANGQLGQAKALVDKLELTRDGADLRIVLAMNGEQVRQLAGLLLARGD